MVSMTNKEYVDTLDANGIKDLLIKVWDRLTREQAAFNGIKISDQDRRLLKEIADDMKPAPKAKKPIPDGLLTTEEIKLVNAHTGSKLKIDAIKAVSNRLGITLQDASRYVKDWMNKFPDRIIKPTAPGNITSEFELTQDEQKLLVTAGTINTIKAVRIRTGMELKEAKDAVLAWIESNRNSPAITGPLPHLTLTPEEINMFQAGSSAKRKVVVAVRDRLGSGNGLYQAKIIVEKWMQDNPEIYNYDVPKPPAFVDAGDAESYYKK